MSIQASVNQGISVVSLLYSQTPKYKQKAEIKQVKSNLNIINKSYEDTGPLWHLDSSDDAMKKTAKETEAKYNAATSPLIQKLVELGDKDTIVQDIRNRGMYNILNLPQDPEIDEVYEGDGVYSRPQEALAKAQYQKRTKGPSRMQRQQINQITTDFMKGSNN